MRVAEAMTTELVTCDIDASLRAAVEGMLRNRVGSTIVVDDDIPSGIVTETDVLHASYTTDDPLSEIPVQKVMSSPLATITKSTTLRQATNRFKEEGVKKLVVVEDMDVVGIITSQDVVHNYHALKSEIHDVLNPEIGNAAEADRFDLDQF